MKLRIYSLLALFFLASLCYGQTAEQAKAISNKLGNKLMKELINIVKRNSIYADSLNWVKVDSEMAILVGQVKSADDEHLLVNYLISQLREVGDKHSFFQNRNRTQTYALKNSVPEQPNGRLLNSNIGYVSVPAFGSTNDTAMVNFAEKIQQIIKDLDSRYKIKGWIVDLRKNGGGNMYPMIAGLGAIINNGTLGYFVPPNTQIKENMAWFYSDGSVGAGGNKILTLKEPYMIRLPSARVAVLVGSGTGSSGEMTALSFIGRQNAKLFGQPTAGYVTANRGFPLSTGSTLVLAVSYTADRNKNKYLINITPDVTIDDSGNSATDNTLNSAITWAEQ